MEDDKVTGMVSFPMVTLLTTSEPRAVTPMSPAKSLEVTRSLWGTLEDTPAVTQGHTLGVQGSLSFIIYTFSLNRHVLF
jgi:hypothetical protein